MKEYNLDNIHEFFEELDNKLNPNIHKMMVWAGYQRDCDARAELKDVEDMYYNSSHPKDRYTAWKISQDMYVVQCSNSSITGYYAHVNNTRSYELFDTFDKAVLGCLAIKYTGRYDAAVWAVKMLGM